MKSSAFHLANMHYKLLQRFVFRLHSDLRFRCNDLKSARPLNMDFVSTLCKPIGNLAGRYSTLRIYGNIAPYSKRFSAQAASQTTLDPSEMKVFQTLARTWWDEQGQFAALHSMNDLRVPFIRDSLLNVHRGWRGGAPLSGIRILDVGCGGGLLSEPLGRLGADVMGIDPVGESIKTAELHISFDPVLLERIQYRTCTLEELSDQETEAFDVIVASELVEHLLDPDTFISCCHQVLKPAGSLFITTINKTNLSYVLGILVAENVLRIVPRGTHQWDKFISPVDLECLLESSGFSVESIRGMLFNPLSRTWSWVQSTSLNYALHAVKRKDDLQSKHADVPSSPEPQSQDGTVEKC